MFSGAGLTVVDLAELAIPVSTAEEEVECHETFEENALAKARYFRRLTGMAVVADDSGLEVEAARGTQ